MFQTKRLIQHSSIYALGNLSRQVVGFVMLPVYTRYLSPSDYGIVGLLIFTVSLTELLFGARMFAAVPKFYYDQDSREQGNAVISTALVITSGISLITVLAVVLSREVISQTLFGVPEHSTLVAVFSVLILTQALEQYTLGYIRIQQRPWLFIGASTTKLVMQLSLNIFLVVILEWGVFGVVLSNAVAAVVFTSGMTIYTLWNTGIHFDRPLGRKLLIFSWPLWLSGLAGLYIGSSNRYFIRIFASLDEVGLFELAAKFGVIISLLVWMPFSQYWQTERFNLYRQPNPIPVYQSVFRLISALLVLVALGVAVFGDPVIRLMAGPEFHAAALAVPYLAFSAVFNSLVFFLNFSFLVKEKTGQMTWNTYITALVISILYFALIPSGGFVGAAQALMLANLAQFAIVYSTAKRHYDMKLSLRPLALYLVISAVATSIAMELDQKPLILDFVMRTAIYLPSCAFIIACFLLNSTTRQRFLRFLYRQKLLRTST